MISRPFFTPRKMRIRMNLDNVANGHFVLGRDVLCEFDYWPLAVSLQRRYARCPLLIRFHPVIIILALLRRGFGTSVPFILLGAVQTLKKLFVAQNEFVSNMRLWASIAVTRSYSSRPFLCALE